MLDYRSVTIFNVPAHVRSNHKKSLNSDRRQLYKLMINGRVMCEIVQYLDNTNTVSLTVFTNVHH